MTLHLFRILQELMNNSLRHGKQHQFQFCSNLSTDKEHVFIRIMERVLTQPILTIKVV
jgi:signal transduction histidine kinase